MRRVSIVLVLIVLLGAAGAAVAAASGWSIQHTPNPAGAKGSSLSGVACTSASACTAVGDYSKGHTEVTLAERWNGTEWSVQRTANPAGGTDIYLYGASCTSENACTAVGTYVKGAKSLTLAERWNGTKWSIQTTPDPAGARGSFLLGVSCTSKSACTAIGWYYKGTTELTLAERWNGTKWSIEHTPTGAKHSELYGVACASKSACTAVGYYAKGDATVTLAERWNGTKWSIQRTPNHTGGQGSFLFAVSCISKSACTAVGNYAKGKIARVMLVERWNGTKWSIQTTPDPAGAKDSFLNGVSCTSKSTCTAVGNYDKGTKSLTLAERWNGTKWSIQTTPDPAGAKDSILHGVSCTSKSACTAIGWYYKGTTELTLAERWNAG